MRKDCTFYKRCFESIEELTGQSGWVWDTFQPSVSKPLLISVGPGRFEGNFKCIGNSGVTVKGSGREHTTFVTNNQQGAVELNGCKNIAFEDLTLLGEGSILRNATVLSNNSESTWTDVDIIAKNTGQRNVAWSDDGDCAAMPTIYFFNTRIWTLGASDNTYNFFSVCSDIWFYGGEILTDLYETSGSNSGGTKEIFNISTSGIFRAFGAAIILKASFIPTSPNAFTPIDIGSEVTADAVVNIWQYNGAAAGKRQFHLHGGIINSSSSVEDIAVVSIYADASLNDDVLVAHTPGTAHNMKVGVNAMPVRLRTVENGRIESPFSWGSLKYPPLANNEGNILVSVAGSDTFFENDCDETGNCLSGGDQSHLMVYDPATCGTEAWYNTRTGFCRNDTQEPIDLADLKRRIEQLEEAN